MLISIGWHKKHFCPNAEWISWFRWYKIQNHEIHSAFGQILHTIMTVELGNYYVLMVIECSGVQHPMKSKLLLRREYQSSLFHETYYVIVKPHGNYHLILPGLVGIRTEMFLCHPNETGAFIFLPLQIILSE